MGPDQLKSNLLIHLESTLPRHTMAEVYRYAVLPPGKLFRPQLVCAIAKDLGVRQFDASSNHALLASFVEIHHAYTLVHDDLPCMDDDDERRGKPSVHKHYGEWKAVLAGDGLLIASYQLLAKMKGKVASDIFKFATWATGPKGLIQGQVMDLSQEMNLSFENLKRTHELKTARLIQLSLAASSWLALESERRKQIKLTKVMFRIGYALGLAFQFLDDLTELADDLGEHELAINPWIERSEEVANELTDRLDYVSHMLNEYQLIELSSVVGNYYGKILTLFRQSEEIIKKKVSADLSPIVLLLEKLSRI